jgi:hypothetical protein
MAKPVRFAGVGAILSIGFSLFGMALGNDAAPDIPYLKNPILVFSSLILVVACAMLVAPRLFNWDWETKYFGVALLHLSSLTLTCMVPCFCLVLYSQLPVLVRISLLLLFAAVHVMWCRRFVVLYRKINGNKGLRALLYEEEDDAVYYMQRADKYLIETQCKFNQVPKDRYFLLFLVVSLLITPLKDVVSSTVGLPFMHIFFLISMLPLSLLGIGFATRGWLVFYCYPREIRKSSGKRVYVDMSGTRQDKRENII